MLGGCYDLPYAIHFPPDMICAQFRLLDHLGITKLYASVRSSVWECSPSVLERSIACIVCITSLLSCHTPYSATSLHGRPSVELRVLPLPPPGPPPHIGMKLSREITTMYRSGLEWEQRFRRQRAGKSKAPALCPDFLIETYLDHAEEKWCLEYDANSLLYVTKAVGLLDL